MKHIRLVITVAIVMAAMLVATAAPGLAAQKLHGVNHNAGYVTTPSGNFNCHQHNAIAVGPCHGE